MIECKDIFFFLQQEGQKLKAGHEKHWPSLPFLQLLSPGSKKW